MYTTFWLQFWPIYRPIISVKSADYRYRPILIFFLIGRSLLLLKKKLLTTNKFAEFASNGA